MAYQGIHFSFAEIQREIENLKIVSEPFLDPHSSLHIIPTWQRTLDLYARDPHPDGSELSWSILEDDPIKTRVSDGEYEAGPRKGTYQLYGSVSGIWHIKKPSYRGRRKKTYRSHFFILDGLASSKIRLWARDSGVDRELARWTFEIGSADSPGCHFHTQIKLDVVDNKFPEDLSIPRLPAIFITPMDAIEFLLAELFHMRWYERVSIQNNATKILTACQADRFRKLFSWHLSKIKESAASPWATFKRQKPPANIFYSP